MKYLILVFVLFTFSTKGASIISTNQYNVPFINSKTLLISIDILTNLPQASCSGFSYIVSNVNNATNYQGLIDRDYQFLRDSSFTVFTQYIMRYNIIKSILSNYQNKISNELYDKLENSLNSINEKNMNDYILTKIMPLDFKSQKILILNYLIYQIFKPQSYRSDYDLEILYIPYMESDVRETSCVISEINE